MTTITIEAVVTNGILKPLTQLVLPEGTKVHAQLHIESVTDASIASLFGAFPELATITADDLVEVKRTWERSLDKQAQTLSGRTES